MFYGRHTVNVFEKILVITWIDLIGNELKIDIFKKVILLGIGSFNTDILFNVF